MTLRWTLVSLILLVAGATSAADDPPEKSTPTNARKARMTAALNALSAETLAERTRAEEELLKLGVELLDELPAVELLPNASAREAVKRVRIELERRRAIASLEASTARLQGEWPASQILAFLEEQTGNVVRFDHLSPKTLRTPLRVDFDAVAYWDAVDELARRLNLAIRYSDASGGLEWFEVDESQSTRELASTRTGPFRVSVRSISQRPLVGTRPGTIARAGITLMAEPRLRPLFVHYALNEQTMTTNEGAGLSPFTPEARYEIPVGNGASLVDMNLDFLLPEKTSAASARLSGAIRMLTAAGSERFEFANLTSSRHVSRRKGGVTVTFIDAAESEAGGPARVDMSVVYDVGGPAFESHRTWVYHNRSFLTRSDATVDHDAGFSTRLQTDGGVVLSYLFSGLAKPLKDYRFVYVAPTLIVDVPIRFRLPAVPLTALKEPAKPAP